MRNFIKYYLFKVIIGIVLIETLFLIWNHNRNHRPEIIAKIYSVFSRQIVRMDPLLSDKDEDKDSLFIEGISQPLHGKVFQKEHFLYYQPNNNFQGIDSFSYIISDGRKKSKSGYIRIEVEKNNAPLSLNDTLMVFNDGTSELQVLNNDIDKENDSIYFDTISTPLYGKIENIKNRLYYTPNNHFIGIDSFQYAITDGGGKSEMTKVRLIVKNGKFSSDPYLGNALNYTFYNTRKYDVLADSNNKVFAISNNLSLPWSGAIQEYCILKNRNYNNFNLRLKAKPLVLEQWVEYDIIFSHKDNNNYCGIHFNYHDGTGRVQCWSVREGNPKYVFSKDCKLYSDAEFHDVEIQKNDGSISIKFDGKFILNASNAVFLNEGAIGFGTRNRTIYFDDINISEK